MSTGMTLDNFSKVAADWIRLRLALYGPADAQALMMRCFKRSKSDKLNERTVLNCWQEQDDALNAALEDITVAELHARKAEQAAQFLNRKP